MGILEDLKVIVEKKPEPTPAPAPAVSPSGTKKVLIVEDEKMLADALAIKFRHEGFEAMTAGDGQAGLDTIIAQKPNIVILDLMMPVMDGKTMLRKLREIEEFKNLPVIVLTNAGDVENMKETHLYYNASEFLVKSNTSTEAIVEKVRDLV